VKWISVPETRISVIGAGYVGLVSFAEMGYDVILSTEDSHKAKLIQEAIAPFYETDLEPTLRRGDGV
jgi:UDP-glucose 6-dehydrogenase